MKYDEDISFPMICHDNNHLFVPEVLSMYLPPLFSDYCKEAEGEPESALHEGSKALSLSMTKSTFVLCLKLLDDFI